MDDEPQNSTPASSNNQQPTPPLVNDINSPSTPAPMPSTTVSPTPPVDGEDSSQLPKKPLQTKPAGGSSKKGLGLAVAVLVILAGATAAYLVMHKSTPKTASSSATKKTVALLRIGVTQPFPPDFYPNIAGDVFPEELSNQMFEGLTKYQGGNQVVPNLAVSWTNPDNNTWNFKLKQGVKFHDGHTMTAAIVKASLEGLQKTNYGGPYTSTIKSIDAPDNSTVKITTSSPDPLLPNELANLLIYDTTSGKTNDPENGSGPYTLKPGTKLTADSAQLIAFDGYQGGTPLVKELKFVHYADVSAVTKAIQQNLLDMGDLSSKSAVDAVQSYGYTAYADKNPQVYFLMPNTVKPNSPLGKLKVRQAIYQALDPTALMKADNRNGSVANQLVPQEIPGYDPTIKRPATDATAAKAALAAAGYPKGFTITFTFNPAHQALANEVQKEMASIGVTLTMDPQTSGAILGKKAFGGQTDLSYFAYNSSLLDASDVAQPLVVDNTPNYNNDQINTIYKQASTTLNTAARLKLLQQINQLAMSDAAIFPLFTPEADYFAIKSNLVMQTDNLADYIGVDFWKVYSN